jgi:hypothetical protein
VRRAGGREGELIARCALKKGACMSAAVEVLDDIQRLMHALHAKKRAMVRHLPLADTLAADANGSPSDSV